jgi:hypothetical protein
MYIDEINIKILSLFKQLNPKGFASSGGLGSD